MSSVTKKYDVYTYEDESIGVHVIAKQIHLRHFEGGGHITVTAKGLDGDRYTVFKGRTQITTEASRKKIGKSIEERVRGDKRTGDTGMQGVFGITSAVVTNDWEATISDAMEQILETRLAGDQPVNLYKEEGLYDEEAWRVLGLLSEDVNVIYGDSGSGKSYLSIILGQAIQYGVPICGLDTVKGNVLLIDYETRKSNMMRRLKRVDKGMNLQGDPLLYRTGNVSLAESKDALQEYIMRYDIQFLIIDSLARAVGGSITDEEGVGLFFEAIRQIDLPCLIIHHTNKGDEYFGSMYIKANARNMWRLRSVPSEGRGVLSLQLEQQKENDGPAMGMLGFRLTFEGDELHDPDSVTLSPEDPAVIPELRKFARLWQQIDKLVRETPTNKVRIDEIEELLNLNKSKSETLRNYVWALRYNTGTYKRLPEVLHVYPYAKNEGDPIPKPIWLCSNSPAGWEDPAEDGYIEEEPIPENEGTGFQVIQSADLRPNRRTDIAW